MKEPKVTVRIKECPRLTPEEQQRERDQYYRDLYMARDYRADCEDGCWR